MAGRPFRHRLGTPGHLPRHAGISPSYRRGVRVDRTFRTLFHCDVGAGRATSPRGIPGAFPAPEGCWTILLAEARVWARRRLAAFFVFSRVATAVVHRAGAGGPDRPMGHLLTLAGTAQLELRPASTPSIYRDAAKHLRPAVGLSNLGHHRTTRLDRRCGRPAMSWCRPANRATITTTTFPLPIQQDHLEPWPPRLHRRPRWPGAPSTPACSWPARRLTPATFRQGRLGRQGQLCGQGRFESVRPLPPIGLSSPAAGRRYGTLS